MLCHMAARFFTCEHLINHFGFSFLGNFVSLNATIVNFDEFAQVRASIKIHNVQHVSQ